MAPFRSCQVLGSRAVSAETEACSRIERRCAALKVAGRGALVAFVTAGDPEPETSLAIVEGLPAAGADLIELGMPFSDPMADGPAVQASSLRAQIGRASCRERVCQ